MLFGFGSWSTICSDLLKCCKLQDFVRLFNLGAAALKRLGVHGKA